MITESEKKLVERVLAFLLLKGTKGEELARELKQILAEAGKIAKGADQKGMLRYAAQLVKDSVGEGRLLRCIYAIDFSLDWKEGVCMKVAIQGLQWEGKKEGLETSELQEV